MTQTRFTVLPLDETRPEVRERLKRLRARILEIEEEVNNREGLTDEHRASGTYFRECPVCGYDYWVLDGCPNH